jgi:hypothetical protein
MFFRRNYTLGIIASLHASESDISHLYHVSGKILAMSR